MNTVIRKDESTVENVELQVHDDTAEATLGLWGIAALSPFATNTTATTNPEAAVSRQSWKPGETVILLQSPSCKIARRVRRPSSLSPPPPQHPPNHPTRQTYLTLTSTTLTDLNPAIPDTLWLRCWSTRTRTREALNPPFPAAPFDPHTLEHGPVRCLYTLAALDEFARAAPTESFQGYLSVVLAEPKLLECWRRRMLCCGECCGMAAYANAVAAACRGCDGAVALRLNPRIVGQVVDETGAVGAGKLLLSDRAWRDLLGREVGEVLRMGFEEVKHLTDRLLFCRVTLLFGWTGDKTVAGGRVCVLGVRA